MSECDADAPGEEKLHILPDSAECDQQDGDIGETGHCWLPAAL